MRPAPKLYSVKVSRRSVLRGMATVAASVSAFSATMTTDVSDAAAKSSQKAVGYQDTPKGGQRCDNCRQFEPPSGCKVVDGTINPGGWCKVYVKKPTAG